MQFDSAFVLRVVFQQLVGSGQIVERNPRIQMMFCVKVEVERSKHKLLEQIAIDRPQPGYFWIALIYDHGVLDYVSEVRK